MPLCAAGPPCSASRLAAARPPSPAASLRLPCVASHPWPRRGLVAYVLRLPAVRLSRPLAARPWRRRSPAWSRRLPAWPCRSSLSISGVASSTLCVVMSLLLVGGSSPLSAPTGVFGGAAASTPLVLCLFACAASRRHPAPSPSPEPSHPLSPVSSPAVPAFTSLLPAWRSSTTCGGSWFGPCHLLAGLVALLQVYHSRESFWRSGRWSRPRSAVRRGAPVMSSMRSASTCRGSKQKLCGDGAYGRRFFLLEGVVMEPNAPGYRCAEWRCACWLLLDVLLVPDLVRW
jgi:hypothetical protein